MLDQLGLGTIIGASSLIVLVALVIGTILIRTYQKRKYDAGFPDYALPEEKKQHVWLKLPSFRSNTQTVVKQSVQPKPEKHTPLLSGLFRKRQPDIVVESPGHDSTEEYLGKLNFGLSYDKEAVAVAVHIISASDLPVKDITGSSDPYVRICLLPDEQHVKVTKIHRRCLSPSFNQTVVFPGFSMKKLHDMTLCMQVMDYDRFTHDDPIGEILLPLKNVKFENCPVYWKNLQQPTVHKASKGELMLSLCYLPQSNKLTCVVVKAKDLPPKEISGYADPYVKLWLVHKGSKLDKKKTTVKSHTLAPVFNESFTFTVTPDKVEEVQLCVAMMDYDLVSNNEEVGYCQLGSKDGSESGKKHWHEMLTRPGYPSAMWHSLVAKW